jgi:multidrug transporter EmrE-like cation transporter
MNLKQLVLTWGMIFSYVILNSAGALLIKQKLFQIGEFSSENLATSWRFFVSLFSSLQVWGGLLAIFISALAWIIALSKMELSVAYPVAIGLNFLIIMTFSVLVNGEPLTVNKMVGVGLIMVSLFFLFRS